MPTTSAAINQDPERSGVTLASGPKKRGRKPKKALPTVKLPPNPFVSEILDAVSKARGTAKKVELLQEHRNEALVSLMIWNFDDTVRSALPEGEVPFKPNDAPAGTEHTSLRQEQRHFYNFIQGGNNSLSKTRRETIFIQILETLHPSEAEILILVKDQRLVAKYPALSQDLIAEAYPDIEWGGRGGTKYEVGVVQ